MRCQFPDADCPRTTTTNAGVELRSRNTMYFLHAISFDCARGKAVRASRSDMLWSALHQKTSFLY